MEFLKLKKDEYAKYYTFEKCVGFGAFCTVFQAIDNLTNERLAVKVGPHPNNHRSSERNL